MKLTQLMLVMCILFIPLCALAADDCSGDMSGDREKDLVCLERLIKQANAEGHPPDWDWERFWKMYNHVEKEALRCDSPTYTANFLKITPGPQNNLYSEAVYRLLKTQPSCFFAAALMLNEKQIESVIDALAPFFDTEMQSIDDNFNEKSKEKKYQEIVHIYRKVRSKYAVPGTASGSSEQGPPRRSLNHGLSVEEHLLRGEPVGVATKPAFEPVQRSGKDILRYHADERTKAKHVSGGSKVVVKNEPLETDSFYVNIPSGHNQVGVKLLSKGKVIYSEVLGDNSPVDAIRGLWEYQGQWVLEVARCKNTAYNKGKGTSIRTDCQSDVIIDGKSISQQHGYREAFNFQLLSGKPFYFFEKDHQIGVSYEGEDTLLGYAEIPHHNCCEPSRLNPKSFQNMVSFYARRDNNWYYVEIGVFR